MSPAAHGLAALVDAAQRARPGLDRDAFAAHLAAVAPEGGALEIADLALAFQAHVGDPGALADDAIQETATRLLLGRIGGGRPLLASYRGTAPLAAWVKTIARRTASRLAAISRRLHGNDAMLDELAGAQDPASAVVKAELRPAVRAAFAVAVQALSYVDRELLASVIVRGETIDALSTRHRVHRATAARWVARARAALEERLRRELATALHLTAADVSEVLSAVAASIELTPARLTAPTPRRRR